MVIPKPRMEQSTLLKYQDSVGSADWEQSSDWLPPSAVSSELLALRPPQRLESAATAADSYLANNNAHTNSWQIW